MKQKIYQLTKLIESNQDEYKKNMILLKFFNGLDLDIDELKLR